MTDKELYGGSTIYVELRGMVNSLKKMESDSFTVTTMTSENYLIDTYAEGLTVFADCDYPCVSCPASEPATCRRCDTDDGSLFPLFF